MEDRVLVLNSKRELSYRLCGASGGRHTALYLHGLPGSRQEAAILHEVGQRASLRIVAPERPGIGASTFQRGRTLVQWADDVRELLESLQVHDFHIIAVSGGAPYGFLLTERFMSRVKSLSVVSGMAPPCFPRFWSDQKFFYRALFSLARRFPASLFPILSPLVVFAKRYPLAWLKIVSRSLSADDKLLLLDGRYTALLSENLGTALTQGVRSIVVEVQILSEAWGIDFSKIQTQVFLYHGTEDGMVPFVGSELINEVLPKSSLTIKRGKGHFMALEMVEEVVNCLKAVKS